MGIFGGKHNTVIDSERRFVTDPELISEYANRLGIPIEDAKFLLDEACASIVYVLEKQGAVNIRKFGMFSLNQRKKAKMYNALKGVWITVPLRYVVKFKATGYLRNLINGKVRGNMNNAFKFMEGTNPNG